MESDLFLVAGVILVVFALPALVSAFSEARVPYVAGIMMLAGGALVFVAFNEQPFSFDGMIEAFVRVAGRVIN